MLVEFELPRPSEAIVTFSNIKQPNDAIVGLRPRFFQRNARGQIGYFVVKDGNGNEVSRYHLTVSGATGRLHLTQLSEVNPLVNDSPEDVISDEPEA